MKKVIIWLFLIGLALVCWVSFARIRLTASITVNNWDSFSVFTNDLSFKEHLSLKIYLMTHTVDLSKIQVGAYSFSWSYSKQAFITTILDGPTQAYTRYTVLEWWSIYDIEADLVKKGFAETGVYLSYVTDWWNISSYAQYYEFLRHIPTGISSLEGFLYPDTYHIDINQDFVKQLVDLQLQAFDTKIWATYQQQLLQFDRWNYSLYDLMILASIVEKEEKNVDNKPTVAGVFFNRLGAGMKLDADITLCYWLQQSYDKCTPSVIAQHITDGDNLYNTRQRAGLTPQIISNPSVETIWAVLAYKDTDYVYYLHDMRGGIHYGRTLEEHNANKRAYLQ